MQVRKTSPAVTTWLAVFAAFSLGGCAGLQLAPSDPDEAIHEIASQEELATVPCKDLALISNIVVVASPAPQMSKALQVGRTLLPQGATRQDSVVVYAGSGMDDVDGEMLDRRMGQCKAQTRAQKEMGSAAAKAARSR